MNLYEFILRVKTVMAAVNGTSVNKSVSSCPTSSSKTLQFKFSVKRFAITHPPEPAPITTKSYSLLNSTVSTIGDGITKSNESCAQHFRMCSIEMRNRQANNNFNFTIFGIFRLYIVLTVVNRMEITPSTTCDIQNAPMNDDNGGNGRL